MRISDWSSDVCSSDLQVPAVAAIPWERPWPRCFARGRPSRPWPLPQGQARAWGSRAPALSRVGEISSECTALVRYAEVSNQLGAKQPGPLLKVQKNQHTAIRTRWHTTHKTQPHTP